LPSKNSLSDILIVTNNCENKKNWISCTCKWEKEETTCNTWSPWISKTPKP